MRQVLEAMEWVAVEKGASELEHFHQAKYNNLFSNCHFLCNQVRALLPTAENKSNYPGSRNRDHSRPHKLQAAARCSVE